MTDVVPVPARAHLLRVKGLSIAITPYADSFGRVFEASVAYACAASKQRGFATLGQAWAWCEIEAPKVMAVAR